MTPRRLIPIALGVGCLMMALLWPSSREVLALAGGYDSNYLGCNGKRELFVEFAQGPDVPAGIVGATCEFALNEFGDNCVVASETQIVDKDRFGTLIRIVCF